MHIHLYPNLFLRFPLRGFSLKLLRLALGFGVVLRAAPGGYRGAQHPVRCCGRVSEPLRACAGDSRPERPG